MAKHMFVALLLAPLLHCSVAKRVNVNASDLNLIHDHAAADPTCANGQKDRKNKLCCLTKCKSCGESGCGDAPGSAAECCRSHIEKAKKSCLSNTAPCLIEENNGQDVKGSVGKPPSDPGCEHGIKGTTKGGARGLLPVSLWQRGGARVCCPSACGQCGGAKCGDKPGGEAECCGDPIAKANKLCVENIAPCVILAPTADPECKAGSKDSKNELCCPTKCGSRCGASSCSDAPGSAAECCRSHIEKAKKSCLSNTAPCLMSVGKPSSDPGCEHGIKGTTKGGARVCCPSACGKCGGAKCGENPGGKAECCGDPIVKANKPCVENIAPCLITTDKKVTTPVKNTNTNTVVTTKVTKTTKSQHTETKSQAWLTSPGGILAVVLVLCFIPYAESV